MPIETQELGSKEGIVQDSDLQGMDTTIVPDHRPASSQLFFTSSMEDGYLGSSDPIEYDGDSVMFVSSLMVVDFLYPFVFDGETLYARKEKDGTILAYSLEA
jgi:hypothetical protein